MKRILSYIMKRALLILALLSFNINLSAQNVIFEGLSMRYILENCTLFLEVTATWQCNGDEIDLSNTYLRLCENPKNEPLYLLTECNNVPLPSENISCDYDGMDGYFFVGMVIHRQKVDKKVAYSAGLCRPYFFDNCLTYSANIGPYEGDIPHIKYDTISIYDTVPVFDTIPLFDTIRIFDTIPILDTIPVFDTIPVLDTIPIFDTIPQYITVYDSIAVTDTLIIDAVLTGQDPPDNIGRILVYPNPAKDKIFIETGDFIKMIGYRLKILDQQGKVVFERNIDKQSYEIDLSSWYGSGLYFIQVIDPGGNILDTRKILLR